MENNRCALSSVTNSFLRVFYIRNWFREDDPHLMRQKLSQILLYWSKEFANANLAVTWRINKILIDFSSSHDKPILVPQAAAWKCFIKKLFWNTKLQKTPTANSFKNRWKPSSPTLLKKDSITRALVNLLKYFRDTTLWNTYEQLFLLFQQQLRYFTKKKDMSLSRSKYHPPQYPTSSL